MKTVAAQPAPTTAQRLAESLLTAPIVPALVRFALPNMAAMLATALAAVAETAYVGSFGVPSLAPILENKLSHVGQFVGA